MSDKENKKEPTDVGETPIAPPHLACMETGEMKPIGGGKGDKGDAQQGANEPGTDQRPMKRDPDEAKAAAPVQTTGASGTQYNIGGNSYGGIRSDTTIYQGTVYTIFGEALQFSDPTDRYHVLKPTKLAEEDGVVRQWREELVKHRLLLLSCEDLVEEPGLLDHAVGGLMQGDHILGQYQLRSWDEFATENRSQTQDIRFQFFAQRKVKFGGNDDPILIVVRLASTRGLFLDSLIRTGVEQATAALRENNLALIIRATSFTKAERRIFPHWRLDFLRYLLRSYFEPDEAAKLYADLTRQRHTGKWGSKSLSDYEFKQQIDNFLGVDDGQEALRKHVQFLMREDDSGLQQEQGFIAKHDKLAKAVLFTGTFLPRLTIHEFDRAFRSVAGEETMEIIEEKESTIIGEKPGDAPRVIKEKVPRSLLLTEEWSKDSDALLKKCSLRCKSTPTGEAIVEFSTPLRVQLQREFESEHAFYTFHGRNRVLASDWFFEENLSEQVLQNLLGFATRAAAFAPANYGRQLLIGVIRGLLEYLRDTEQAGGADLARELSERVSDGVDTQQDLEEVVRVVFEKQEFWDDLLVSRKKHIYLRLSQLCRRMLEETSLARTVNDFFEEMLKHEQYDVVLIVGEKLRDAENFDYFEWLRRLLNTGSPALWTRKRQQPWAANRKEHRALIARARVQEWLDGEISQADASSLVVIEAVRTWLPPEDKETNRFTMAECYALIFLQRFGERVDRSADIWKKEKYDEPVSHPILDRWAAGQTDFLPDSVLKEIKQLADWLTHPGLPFAARIQWLDSLTGAIQHHRPYRGPLLDSLRASFGGDDLPSNDNVEGWEAKLQEIARCAEDNDFAALQISTFLAQWTTLTLPLLGEPKLFHRECWQQLVDVVAKKLVKRKPLTIRMTALWCGWAESLLNRLDELPATRENKVERTTTRAIRSLLLRLARQFQAARSVASNSSNP